MDSLCTQEIEEELDNMSDGGFLTSDEGASDDSDYYDILRQLDFYDDGSKTNEEPDCVQNNRENILARSLVTGLKQLRKSYEMQAQALLIIEKVACKAPNLESLISVFAPLCPPHIRATKANINFATAEPGCSDEKDHGTPEIVSFDSKGKNHPKRSQSFDGKVRFECQYCPYTAGSHAGADSHIREIHSHLKIGPCINCKLFSTYNMDSYKRHLKTCKKN